MITNIFPTYLWTAKDGRQSWPASNTFADSHSPVFRLCKKCGVLMARPYFMRGRWKHPCPAYKKLAV